MNIGHMKQTLFHCARLTTWALTAVLASSSAFGAEAVAPWLTLDQQHSYPRLAWTNVLGHTYLLQMRERLNEGDWSLPLTLSADSKTAAWTDEAEPGVTRFYRVGAQANTN